jgi:hypothetical protein
MVFFDKPEELTVLDQDGNEIHLDEDVFERKKKRGFGSFAQQ